MFNRLIIAALCALTIGTAQAETQQVDVDAKHDIEVLKMNLQTLYTATKITSVRTTPVSGLYEIVMGRNLIYTDKFGKYFVFGSIVDMKTQHDLSADRREEINLVDLDTMPLADAIPVVHGKGTRKLFVFSDPECPYCKRAEESLKDVEDVTIYVFMMPLAQLHPQAAKLSESIWCSKDRVQAWTDWMLKGIKPADATCDNPIERNLALAAGMNIHGTPTFIREDGQIKSGAPSKGQLDNYLVKEQ